MILPSSVAKGCLLHTEGAQALMYFVYLFCWCFLLFFSFFSLKMTQTSQVDRGPRWYFLFQFTPGQSLCEMCFCSRYYTQNYLQKPWTTLCPCKWDRNRWGGWVHVCRIQWQLQPSVQGSRGSRDNSALATNIQVQAHHWHPVPSEQPHRPGRCDTGPEGDVSLCSHSWMPGRLSWSI